MNIPILSGIYSDVSGDYRTSYPVNMVPVIKPTGISDAYMRPAPGLVQFAATIGRDRGGIVWNGVMYRVLGQQLCKVLRDGVQQVVGSISGTDWCSFAYSFDRLAICADGKLYYYNGATLVQVSDPDLGTALDVEWIDGYFITTDGVSLVQTELVDPTAVNPLKYGSAEADPDPVIAVMKVRNELWVLNRHTVEVFDNVGGDLFAFQRIEGAMIPRGCVGVHGNCKLNDGSIAFLGGGRNEPISIWQGTGGQAAKIATREVEVILSRYTESQLSAAVMEFVPDQVNAFVMLHLPDQTLVYDIAASSAAQQPVWAVRSSDGQYRAQGWVYAYDRWIFGDPQADRLGSPDAGTSYHYGEPVAWSFETVCLYNEGLGGLIHAVELTGLTGRVALGANPTIWTSWSSDGLTFSQEQPISVGVQGDTLKRLAWRRQGRMPQVRIQRFRGNSDAHISVSSLRMDVEPLGA